MQESNRASSEKRTAGERDARSSEKAEANWRSQGSEARNALATGPWYHWYGLGFEMNSKTPTVHHIVLCAQIITRL